MQTFLTAEWENLIMANYEVPVATLMPYLPKGVELDLRGGKAYVSLVGFMFRKSKIFKIPIPFMGSFEEVNLRFYVVRQDGDTPKRGVVFINETVPYLPVAWLANKLYKEHYRAVPTKHVWNVAEKTKYIEYQWKCDGAWNKVAVNALAQSNVMASRSFEQFIFDHFWGYTRVDADNTIEYRINHPDWLVNEVVDFDINCQFDRMYGLDFAFLNDARPHSVFLAEGSAIAVDWKRSRI